MSNLQAPLATQIPLRQIESGHAIVGIHMWGEPGCCRFCGQSSRRVKFRKDAHLMPASFGNRNWFLADECDDCNLQGGTLEDQLGKMLIADRIMAQIAPRSGTLTHKTTDEGSRAVARPRDGEIDITLASLDEMGVVLVAEREGTRVLVKRQKFTPVKVARALARIPPLLLYDARMLRSAATIVGRSRNSP